MHKLFYIFVKRIMKQFLYKIIYNSSINIFLRKINKVLLPILPRKIKIPPSGIIKLSNKTGNKISLKTNQTSYLTYTLYWDGYLNFEYTDIFIELIKKVDSFFDIGANIGYYSLLAAMENPSIKVVAFEPAKGPLHYLNQNVSLNKFNNITVEDSALSHITGEIDFYEIYNKKYTYLKHNLSGESNAGSKTTGRSFSCSTVNTTTFDKYIKEKKITHIDLVKIDTEGTEYLILKNSNLVLETIKPIVICETLFNVIEDDLEKLMKSHDYLFFNHTPRGLLQVDTITREHDDGIRNCFFVPSNKVDLIEPFICDK